ncbi:MAG: hypothetical protein HY401_10325 [Elusimicrobia bacterium]|nr:hypothetical protein [Elusimicrobiota bacterium]
MKKYCKFPASVIARARSARGNLIKRDSFDEIASPGARNDEAGKILKKYIKPTLFIFLIPPLFLGCSKTQQENKSTEPRFYQSDIYPLRVDFVKGATIKPRWSPASAALDIQGDLGELCPEEPHNAPGMFDPLLNIMFYSSEEEFKKYFIDRFGPIETKKDVSVGNIPALRFDSEGFNILLIPGTYAVTFGFGGCDRFEQVRRETLKRVQWLKPIDTNSQEFKAWKAHILSLINK